MAIRSVGGVVVALAFAPSVAWAAQFGVCEFDFHALQFAGTPVEQSECLLRPVKIGADLGEPLTQLPAPLDALIGTPTHIAKAALRQYLVAHGIAEKDIGGSLDEPVSTVQTHAPHPPLASYFVIHDTSNPNCSDSASHCAELGKLPANMDAADWPFNDQKLIQRYPSGNPVAHVFIARTGISKTGFDFSHAWKAVKLESESTGANGLFLHVENVQPRIGKPAIPAPGKRPNDLIAPMPGLTAGQYDRLAVVYVAASLRRGQWLIPGFHAVIDSGISDGHDDPQNFDLNAWASALAKVIADVGGSP